MKQYQFIQGEYKKGNRSREAISLTKSYSLFFSKAFCEKNTNNPQKERYVTLYFDPKKLAIAIRFATNKSKDSFKVTYDKRGHGAQISCRNFLQAFHIDADKYSGQYPTKKYSIEGEGEAFILDLKERR